jgi:hypothetical protein
MVWVSVHSLALATFRQTQCKLNPRPPVGRVGRQPVSRPYGVGFGTLAGARYSTGKLALESAGEDACALLSRRRVGGSPKPQVHKPKD